MPADREDPEKLPMGMRVVVILGSALSLWAVILGVGYLAGSWLGYW